MICICLIYILYCFFFRSQAVSIVQSSPKHDQQESNRLHDNMEWSKSLLPQKQGQSEYFREYSMKRGAKATTLDSVLEKVSGVYNSNNKKRLMYKTENLVLVNVVSIGKDVKRSTYKSLLLNWFCFASQYGYQPLTYIVPGELTYAEQVQQLEHLGAIGEFIDYPTVLFWSLVAKKRTPVRTFKGSVDYAGSTPSFAHFGALVKIVPLLHVLQRGYHVLFFDLDVAFVHDPIPYLLKGNSDFIVSLEMKSCFCPSVKNISVITNWTSLEPNTGVALIRSNENSIKMVYKWIQNIVDINIANDQKVLKLVEFGWKISFDCNEYLNQYSDELINKYNHHLPDRYKFDMNELSKYPRYCFLNEYLFQNGKVALHCARTTSGIAHGSLAEYILAFEEQNFTYYDTNRNELSRLNAPATIHMNFSPDKISDLKSLNLWLVQDNAVEANVTERSSSANYPNQLNLKLHNICKTFNISNSPFSGHDQESKVKEARKEIDNVWKSLKNDSILKPIKRSHILYHYVNGIMREIPNEETFRHMGFLPSMIYNPRPYNLFQLIPKGDPYPSLQPQESKNENIFFPTRTAADVRRSIEHTVGVYYDPIKRQKHGTHKTIVLIVLSVKDSLDESDDQMTSLIHNFYCYMNHFHIRPLAYVLPSPRYGFSDQVRDLHERGIFGDFVSYPTELFWSYVNKYRSSKSFKPKAGSVDYVGTVPSYDHFGDLVKLIPIIEIIALGYDVLYLDVDNVMLQDPIPHLLKGSADIQFTMQTKSCYLPSVPIVGLNIDWQDIRPNTGIMRVKSNSNMIDMMEKWIGDLIGVQSYYDYTVVDYNKFGLKLSFDCNEQLYPFSDQLNRNNADHEQNLNFSQAKQAKLLSPEGQADMRIRHYCFYNEYLIQNGKIALKCSSPIAGSSKAEYILAMDMLNLTIYSPITRKYEKSIAPIMIHMNTYGNKVNELNSLGLYLFQYATNKRSGVCKHFDYFDTKYGKMNWETELSQAKEEINRITDILRNGSVLQLVRSHLVLYRDNRFHIIPNEKTLQALGYNRNDVHYPGRYNLLKAIPFGMPIQSI